jgi:hypothetical protein
LVGKVFFINLYRDSKPTIFVADCKEQPFYAHFQHLVSSEHLKRSGARFRPIGRRSKSPERRRDGDRSDRRRRSESSKSDRHRSHRDDRGRSPVAGSSRDRGDSRHHKRDKDRKRDDETGSRSRDRFYGTPFRPNTFYINFRPQILDKFPFKNYINYLSTYLLWSIILDFNVLCSRINVTFTNINVT